MMVVVNNIKYEKTKSAVLRVRLQKSILLIVMADSGNMNAHQDKKNFILMKFLYINASRRVKKSARLKSMAAK